MEMYEITKLDAQSFKAEQSFFLQSNAWQINTVDGRLHIAEAPSYHTYSIRPRDAAESEDIKVGLGVPGQQTTLSSLSHLLSFPLSSARRSLKGKSSSWVTAWVKASLSDNKLSSNLSNFFKTISPHSFSFSFSLSSFIWAWWLSISITLMSQSLFQGVT